MIHHLQVIFSNINRQYLIRKQAGQRAVNDTFKVLIEKDLSTRFQYVAKQNFKNKELMIIPKKQKLKKFVTSTSVLDKKTKR